MTSLHWRDELMFQVHTTIEGHGFFIQYVMGERCDPSWGYTIGFLAHGHPEVVVFGLDDVSTAGALHHLYKEVVDRRHRPVGADEEQDLAGLPMRLLRVPDAHWSDASDRLCTAVEYYRAFGWDPEQLSALQLVWATPSGEFPWELECSERFRHLQPILDPGFPQAA